MQAFQDGSSCLELRLSVSHALRQRCAWLKVQPLGKLVSLPGWQQLTSAAPLRQPPAVPKQPAALATATQGVHVTS
eukprot:1143063-Pelagomonas_calceolata.AAC.3